MAFGSVQILCKVCTSFRNSSKIVTVRILGASRLKCILTLFAPKSGRVHPCFYFCPKCTIVESFYFNKFYCKVSSAWRWMAPAHFAASESLSHILVQQLAAIPWVALQAGPCVCSKNLSHKNSFVGEILVQLPFYNCSKAVKSKGVGHF